MPKISAVIITYNEEQHIERCIQSLRGVVDEVLVMDSFSTDRTREIAQNMNARVMVEPWMGYRAMKNLANSLAENNWILSIDADEALSPMMSKSILQVKNNLSGAYSFNRLNNYYGKWIKHGGIYPDRKIRLFEGNKARWTGGNVHETLELGANVPVNFLTGDLLHYTCANVEAHIQQIQRFTTLAAEELKTNGKKPSLLRMYFNSKFKFVKMFVLKMGFLDGEAGYLVAMNSAYSVALREAKLWQLWQDDKKKANE